MIQYALKCAEGHSFDSWFQSADAFDRLLRTSMVNCAVCGGTKVEKAVMTPRVSTTRGIRIASLWRFDHTSGSGRVRGKGRTDRPRVSAQPPNPCFREIEKISEFLF